MLKKGVSVASFIEWNQQQEQAALAKAAQLVPGDSTLAQLATQPAVNCRVEDALLYIDQQWRASKDDAKWMEAFDVLLAIVAG